MASQTASRSARIALFNSNLWHDMPGIHSLFGKVLVAEVLSLRGNLSELSLASSQIQASQIRQSNVTLLMSTFTDSWPTHLGIQYGIVQ
jgi:hypothetical protein